MSDWLHGAPHDVALSFGGDVVRYADLARLVGAARLPEGDGAIGCPAGVDPVVFVTTVLAALDRGRPVIVGASDDEAARLTPLLPARTELGLLTSGSSGADGMPRVIARTNESWLASAEPLAELAGIGSADRVVATGPLHVSMHLYAVLHALRMGATVVDTAERATVAHATPTRLHRMLDGDATTPGVVVVAGAALAPALRERAVERGIRLVEYYGAAELSFVLGGTDGSLRAFPGVEVELRDRALGPAPHARSAPHAGTELWASSPYLALDAVGGGELGPGMLRRDARGFATVGDLAEADGRGGVRVLGRADAAIVTAGATVLAEDVEARLTGIPGVEAAAVIGEPHELLGERVVAVVELAAGIGVDRVAALARSVLASSELPRRWVVRQLPRTASGKVARGVLREEILAESTHDGATTHEASSTHETPPTHEAEAAR
ncbi:AMP-binding protein [Agromyces sp. LHK192]|uniref:AMP-binding enzyme n=1 Tax=Agromyces sp. LHK192 TaxID=2498704 RepID=UPI000FDAD24A|nr:AMP-binding protein [Agromyces sp. LHK192]